MFGSPQYQQALAIGDVKEFVTLYQTRDTSFGLSLSPEAKSVLQRHFESRAQEHLFVMREQWQNLQDIRLKNEIRKYIASKIDENLDVAHLQDTLERLNNETLQKGDVLLVMATYVHQYGIDQLSDEDFITIAALTKNDENITEQMTLYQQDTSQSKQDTLAISEKEKFGNFMEYLYFKFLHNE